MHGRKLFGVSKERRIEEKREDSMQSEEKKERKEVCANERFFVGFNVLLDRNALDRRLVREYERRPGSL